MPFGCSGGFQLTKIESPDITLAFTALGASGTVTTMSVMSAEARQEQSATSMHKYVYYIRTVYVVLSTGTHDVNLLIMYRTVPP
jgi:fluoride ion exporter CrcB/FEX